MREAAEGATTREHPAAIRALVLARVHVRVADAAQHRLGHATQPAPRLARPVGQPLGTRADQQVGVHAVLDGAAPTAALPRDLESAVSVRAFRAAASPAGMSTVV